MTGDLVAPVDLVLLIWASVVPAAYGGEEKCKRQKAEFDSD
jgi:hypothetical protein